MFSGQAHRNSLQGVYDGNATAAETWSKEHLATAVILPILMCLTLVACGGEAPLPLLQWQKLPDVHAPNLHSDTEPIPTATPIPGPERPIYEEPWIRDGVINKERPYIEALTRLVYISPWVFEELIALPWMDRPSRGDNQDALETIVQLNRLATVNEAAALRALALPLLNGPQPCL